MEAMYWEWKMKKPFLKIITFYQKKVSPFLRPSCRFHPTCSEYAKISIERFGLAQGLWFLFKRVIRCNPLGGSGYDPVPDKK